MASNDESKNVIANKAAAGNINSNAKGGKISSNRNAKGGKISNNVNIDDDDANADNSNSRSDEDEINIDGENAKIDAAKHNKAKKDGSKDHNKDDENDPRESRNEKVISTLLPSVFEIVMHLLFLMYPLACYLVFKHQLRNYKKYKAEYMSVIPGITEEMYKNHVLTYGRIDNIVALGCLVLFQYILAEMIVRCARAVMGSKKLFVSENVMGVFFGLTYLYAIVMSNFGFHGLIKFETGLFNVISLVLAVSIFGGTMLIKISYYRYYLRHIYIACWYYILDIVAILLKDEDFNIDSSRLLTSQQYTERHGTDFTEIVQLINEVLGDSEPVRNLKYYFLEDEKNNHVPMSSFTSLRRKAIYIKPNLQFYENKASVFSTSLMDIVSEMVVNRNAKCQWIMIAYCVAVIAVFTLFVLFCQKRTMYFNTFFNLISMGIFFFALGHLIESVTLYHLKCKADDYMFSRGFAERFIDTIKTLYNGDEFSAIENDVGFFSDKWSMIFNGMPSAYSRMKRAERYLSK